MNNIAILTSDLLSEENDSPIFQMSSSEPQLVPLLKIDEILNRAYQTKPAGCHALS